MMHLGHPVSTTWLMRPGVVEHVAWIHYDDCDAEHAHWHHVADDPLRHNHHHRHLDPVEVGIHRDVHQHRRRLSKMLVDVVVAVAVAAVSSCWLSSWIDVMYGSHDASILATRWMDSWMRVDLDRLWRPDDDERRAVGDWKTRTHCQSLD